MWVIDLFITHIQPSAGFGSLFEFIQVEGGMKFMKYFKGGGGESYKTSGNGKIICVFLTFRKSSFSDWHLYFIL
jgi:hypothetical protein